jgi:hypothetical protein
MQLFSKREKINRDTFNSDFNQNFYGRTALSRPSTFPIEQIGKDLRNVSVRTNNIYTTNEPNIKVDYKQLENYFDNSRPVNNRPNNIEYKITDVNQKQDPLNLVIPVLFRSVSDKTGIQFAANSTSLRETELRSSLKNTRSDFPYNETDYD